MRRLAAPSNIASINQKIEGENATVEVALIGDVDVHSFREDKNYIVDVGFQQAEKPSPLRRRRPRRPRPSPRQPRSLPTTRQPRSSSGEIVPPTSETIAQQAKLEAEARARDEAAAAGSHRPRPRPLLPPKRRRLRLSSRRRRKSCWPPPSHPWKPSRQRRRPGRGHAQQRRAAPDVFIRSGDAGGAVPPRRHGVAGVRFRKAGRSRADPPRGADR